MFLENGLRPGFSHILDYLLYVYYKISLEGSGDLRYRSHIEVGNRVPLGLLSLLLEGDIVEVSFNLSEAGFLYDNGDIDFEGLSYLSSVLKEPLIGKLFYLLRARTIKGVPYRNLRRCLVYGMTGCRAIFKECPSFEEDFFYDYDYVYFSVYLSSGYYSLFYFGLLNGIYLEEDLDVLESSVLG